MPSFPGGVSRSASCFTLPSTVMVGLVFTVFTINRRPLGNCVSVIFRSCLGTFSDKRRPRGPVRQRDRLGWLRSQLLASAKTLGGNRASGGHRLQDADHRVLCLKVLLCQPVHIGRLHRFDGVNLVLGRVTPVSGQGLRPRPTPGPGPSCAGTPLQRSPGAWQPPPVPPVRLWSHTPKESVFISSVIAALSPSAGNAASA